MHLSARAKERTPARSIDGFFEALAEDRRDRAIGVSLSGTASDGTLGLEAIEAEGGITFAQDDSARSCSAERCWCRRSGGAGDRTCPDPRPELDLGRVIEPGESATPAGRDSDSGRAEKLQLFRAMRPLDPACVMRGQFRGYRAEKGVAADSQVETFAALCLHIDTWRWGGVPFYIHAGNCLPITAPKSGCVWCPPLAIFDEISQATSNYSAFGSALRS